MRSVTSSSEWYSAGAILQGVTWAKIRSDLNVMWLDGGWIREQIDNTVVHIQVWNHNTVA